MMAKLPNGLPSVIEFFSLRILPAESDECEPTTSELQYNGRDTGIIVDGTFIRAQYGVGDRYLLLIEDMVMHEEGLYIYLIDAKLNILDKITFLWIYVSATPSNLSVKSNDEFEFDTFGCHWHLKTYSKPRFRMPLPWGPDGAWRKMSWKTYFSLSKFKTGHS